MPLKGGGAVRWERQDTPDLHYMATALAMRRRQWAGEDRLSALRDRIDATTKAGRVAWVDVKENGEFVRLSGAARRGSGQHPSNPEVAAPPARRAG